MAALSITKRAFSLFKRPFLPARESFKSARALSITSYKRKLFGEDSVEKATHAHSKLLSKKDTLYEFECKCYQFKNVSSLLIDQEISEVYVTALVCFL